MWYASGTNILKLSPKFCRQHHDVTKINMTKIKRVFWVWAWQIAKSFIVSESDSKFLNKSKKYEVLIGRKFFHFRASHWLFSIYFHASEYCIPLMIFDAMILKYCIWLVQNFKRGKVFWVWSLQVWISQFCNRDEFESQI